VPARPLHRRPDRIALLEAQVLAHPDFFSVAEYRRPRQRKEQAVGELKAALVAEHRCEPAADTTAIELHRGFGCEAREDGVALVVRQTTEVEFVVIATESAPTERR
jgi:hypothetical protein